MTCDVFWMRDGEVSMAQPGKRTYNSVISSGAFLSNG
jgi:hypothetical protein